MQYKLADLFNKPISGEWGTEIKNDQKGVKVIRTTNFTNRGVLDLNNVVERNIDINKHKEKILKNGDIIIEKSGGSPTKPVGRVVIFEENNNEQYLCNNFTAILRPRLEIIPKFALYMMQNLYNKNKVLKFQNKTTGIINLKLNDYLNSTNVYVPDLKKQNKIVEVLDKIQELIYKRKTQIESLDELVKSKFIEMFGEPISNPKKWNVVKLGKISSVGSSKRVFIDELVNEGIPFYRGTEIGALSTGKNVEPTLFITKEHYEKLKNITGVPTIGDLLMPSICPDGRIWSVDTKKPFYFKDGRVLWIHLESLAIKSMFLKYMLCEKFNREYNKIASGTTFAELKIFVLKDLDIIMPPIELQNEFVDFVKETDKLKFEMEKSLEELENNFNSLMQRAFNGELFNEKQ